METCWQNSKRYIMSTAVVFSNTYSIRLIGQGSIYVAYHDLNSTDVTFSIRSINRTVAELWTNSIHRWSNQHQKDGALKLWQWWKQASRVWINSCSVLLIKRSKNKRKKLQMAQWSTNAPFMYSGRSANLLSHIHPGTNSSILVLPVTEVQRIIVATQLYLRERTE